MVEEKPLILKLHGLTKLESYWTVFLLNLTPDIIAVLVFAKQTKSDAQKSISWIIRFVIIYCRY